MTNEEAEARIRHRIASGMVDRDSLRVIITKDEASALLEEVYRLFNHNYLDAPRKGEGFEAALLKPAYLDFLALMRNNLREGNYNEILDNVVFNDVFGVDVEVR